MTDKLHSGRASKKVPTRTKCVSTNTPFSTPKANDPSNMFSGMRAITSPRARRCSPVQRHQRGQIDASCEVEGAQGQVPRSLLIDWITASAPPDRVNLVAVTDQDSEESGAAHFASARAAQSSRRVGHRQPHFCSPLSLLSSYSCAVFWHGVLTVYQSRS